MNQNSYVGSSMNLARRLKEYFNIYYLERELKKGNRAISSALLKHGYANFSLEILEYCDPDKIIIREQYYLDLLKPEYNILQTAGSLRGYKHSEEVKAKIRAYTLTSEQKAKLSEHLEKLNSSEDHIERLRQNRAKQVKKVEVVDILTTEKQVFPSISEAAGAIGVTPEAISNVFRRRKEVDFIVIKKRYQIKKISD